MDDINDLMNHFIDEENNIHPESSSGHEIAGFENYGREDMDSSDIYTHYVRFYDLVRYSSIQKQFTSNVLDAQLYMLRPNDIKAISEALKQNNHVTTLNLSMNKLDTTGCSYLSDLLQKNHVIKHLELSRCNIDCQSAIELAKCLEMSVLNSLNLSYNKIEKAGLQSILKSLQANTYLQVLDLSYNDIRYDCGKDLSMFIKMNEKLEKLDFSGNFLNKKSDLSLFIETLGASNNTLQALILQRNGISSDAASIFENLIIKSKRLKKLDLSGNKLRNFGEILGEGIKKTTILEDLDISYNPITTNDIVELLQCVVKKSSLRRLGMSHILVDEQLEKAISEAQLKKPNFIVEVEAYTGIKTEPIDFQTFFLQRLHFLGVTKPKTKSKKVDIGHILLNMKEEGTLKPTNKSVFLRTFKLKYVDMKYCDETIDELAQEFEIKNKKIDVISMLDKYLELYPDTT